MSKQTTMVWLILVFACTLVASCAQGGGEGAQGGQGDQGSEGDLNIAFIPKNTNNTYFETVADGAREAAKELNGEFKQVGPAEASASEQIPFINTLTQQQVSAISVSANDPDALAPALKRAQAQGITVTSYDADVAEDARALFFNQASNEDIGRKQAQLMGEQVGYKGEIAILSAASTASNQNAWIEFIKEEMSNPKYKDMEIVRVAYGDDDEQKSYEETLGLLQAYPNLKGIISPTAVGIVAAARAIEAQDKGGKVAITGVGTPNGMREYVKNGVAESFILWNPKDLGYLTYYGTAKLLQGDIEGKPGETFKAGRLGERTVGDNGEVILGPPLVFDKSNIDEYDF